jgi:hypothetical protein
MEYQDQKMTMIEYLHSLSVTELLDILIALGLISILLITMVIIRQGLIRDKLDEVPHLIATSNTDEDGEEKVIHCWEDHPDAPLECICASGKKEAGEPCVLNRH